MVYPKVKHLIFQYYFLAALLFVVVVGAWFVRSSKSKDEITILLTALGGLASAVYFIQKQKLEELRLFKELFMSFNRRYDKINESLNRIASGESAKELTIHEIDILNDYFNLCSEEYLFYRRGYIYQEVWRAWHNGMRFFVEEDERIRRHWEQERTNDSYYGLEIASRI